MFSLVFLPKRFLSLAPPPGGAWSCAGLRLSKNSLPAPLFSRPPFLPKAGAKVLPFSHSASTFFNYFSSFSHLADCQVEKIAKILIHTGFLVPF
jgi:hypothetical protein